MSDNLKDLINAIGTQLEPTGYTMAENIRKVFKEMVLHIIDADVKKVLFTENTKRIQVLTDLLKACPNLDMQEQKVYHEQIRSILEKEQV